MDTTFIEKLWKLLASLSVVVATIMGYVKGAWKPEKKWKYWLVAVPLSAIVAALALWYLQAWNIIIFIISTFIVAATELLGNNEIWPHIKNIFSMLVEKLRKK